MWRSRLFWRLFGTYGVLWIISTAVMGFVIVQREKKMFVKEMEARLLARSQFLAAWVRAMPDAEVREIQGRLESLDRETGTRITLIAEDGRVLADSRIDPNTNSVDNHADRPEVRSARESGVGIVEQRLSNTVHEEMMYVALEVEDHPGEVRFVRTALPLETVNQQLRSLSRLVWTAVFLVAVTGMGLSFWLAGRQSRPLREMAMVARSIAAGDYSKKVDRPGRDEIAELAHAFNHMSEQLGAQFAQLEEDRQLLRTILSGMVEGVVALDAEQRVLFVNERGAQLLSFPKQRSVGKKLWQVVRNRSLQDAVQKALSSGEPICEEVNMEAGANTCLTVHAARLPGTPPRGAVLVLHDTTDIRRLERMRQDFVANVSHELKTPLSVIKVCVETLLDGAIDDLQHRGSFLEKIADQSERLHALILDLLSLARIESGEEVFEFQELQVRACVQSCVERLLARATARNQTIDVEGDEKAVIWADEEAVAEILDNLVDNAVKYSPEGGKIALSWQLQDGRVVLQVSDTGIGIPEQDLQRIFERFYRVDKARSREMGGTGLGLSIVKHLVQAMRGTVKAGSRLGAGSAFTVSLPQRGNSRHGVE